PAIEPGCVAHNPSIPGVELPRTAGLRHASASGSSGDGDGAGDFCAVGARPNGSGRPWMIKVTPPTAATTATTAIAAPTFPSVESRTALLHLAQIFGSGPGNRPGGGGTSPPST